MKCLLAQAEETMGEHDLRLHDLMARRRNAGMRSDEIAWRLGFNVDTFRDLETGRLCATAELLQQWEGEIERAEERHAQRKRHSGLSQVLRGIEK